MRTFKKIIKSHPILLSITRKILRIYTVYFMIFLKKIFNFIDKKTDKEKLMINIGGGLYFRRHWKVMDFHSKWYNYSKGCIDYEYDLTSDKPFPLTDNSISFFYCSHTLEHIPQEHCQHILNEIYRCLKQNGAVRFTMPNFDLAYEAFGKNNIDFFVKYDGQNIEQKFLRFFVFYLADKVRPEELRKNYKIMSKEKFADHYTKQVPRETQKKLTGCHLNWWDFEKLKRMLKQVGFKKIYRSVEQGSHFAEMRGFGKNGFDSTSPEISLFVEAVK